MARRYFGTDGVRGTVGQNPITPDFVLLLGQAAGRVFSRYVKNGRATVLIGKDTRVSGYMLEAALEAGFSAAGVDTLLCGPVPTPAVAYLTRALRLEAGVVISASHNPYHDNGIKFFSAQGTKLPDSIEEEIEAEMDKGFACVESDNLGKAKRLDDASGRYVEFCKSTFPHRYDLKGLKLYLDCANGAAYHVAPAVFHELGAEVVVDGASPDGFNINRGVGATHTETLSARTRAAGCDMGLAFDGDADRLIMADNEGNIYDGDSLLYVMAFERIVAQGHASGVVGTLMTNYGLEKRLAQLKIEFARAKVGDRYVMELLKQKGWLYGGEGSGHLIALDCQTTGDGIVSALQVLSAVMRRQKTLKELCADLTLMPQVLINKRIEKGYDWQGNAEFMTAVESAQKAVDGRGRVFIRPSGTEPLLRIMVEADDKALAQGLAESMANALK